MARIAAAVGIAKIAARTPAMADPRMTTTKTATGGIRTAPAMTNWVTTTWMRTAVAMLIAAAAATSSGARIRAKAGGTPQPMSGPIHGMNTIRPAMTAMRAPYGI